MFRFTTMTDTELNRDPNPVRALVLSGGGGRGAYEVGVMRACAERNFHFDWIVGTSIGAINACMAGQNNLDFLIDLWTKIRSQDIYKFPDPAHLRRVVFGQQLGFLDTSPLEKLLRSCISLDRLKSGRTNVGFVTTDLCTLSTKVITSDEIETQDDLIDILMASSAIPLLFPPRKLRGEGCWIDGGLVRNTPIQAAISLGATEIYAVLVEPNSISTCPNSLVQLVSRLAEIIFDQSARSGIAHVTQHNRIVDLRASGQERSGNYCIIEGRERTSKTFDDTGTDGKGHSQSPPDVYGDCDYQIQSAFDFVNLSGNRSNHLKPVRLFIVTPARQVVGSILEIDPIISSWLLTLGHDDIIRKCQAVA